MTRYYVQKTKYLFFLSIVITFVAAKDGPVWRDMHSHLHQKRASVPSGYTKLSSDATKLPSFDDCINYQILDNSLSASFTQACANICSKDGKCNFFAIWNTPSANVSPYCGWWTTTFKTSDVTQTSTDNNEGISNAMLFNKASVASSSTSTKMSSTSGSSIKSIASPSTAVKTTSNSRSTMAGNTVSSLMIPQSTSSTKSSSNTSRPTSNAVSPTKVTSTGSTRKSDSTIVTLAPSSTSSTPTTSDVDTVLFSATLSNYKFAYAGATGIPSQSDGHMINYFHWIGNMQGCADICAQTTYCKFFTAWWATGINYGKYGLIDVIDCAIYDKVYSISDATVSQFDSGGVRNGVGYAVDLPTVPGYKLAYDTAAGIPPQDDWHMLNWYHNLDGGGTNQTFVTCAQYCSQTSGCVFWTVWRLYVAVDYNTVIMTDCAIYNKVFTVDQASVSTWDGEQVVNAVGYSKK